VILPANNVEPALGRALRALLRHEAGGVRLRPQGDRHHFLGGSQFEIERNGKRRLEAGHVLVADVAAVLAQMRRNAVGPASLREKRRSDRIGMRTAAGVPHGRDMVDIDAEAQGSRHRDTHQDNSPV